MDPKAGKWQFLGPKITQRIGVMDTGSMTHPKMMMTLDREEVEHVRGRGWWCWHGQGRGGQIACSSSSHASPPLSTNSRMVCHRLLSAAGAQLSRVGFSSQRTIIPSPRAERVCLSSYCMLAGKREGAFLKFWYLNLRFKKYFHSLGGLLFLAAGQQCN